MVTLHSAWFGQQVGLYSLQIQPIVSLHPSFYGLIQILTALVIGLLTAFAFQFLLTSLGIAIGISALQIRSARSEEPTQKPESSVTSISTWAELGILSTVNVVLFAACFLAVKFSQVNQPMLGAIEGIVIWSAYFLLLLWLSSTAVSSCFGLILNTTTDGFRRIVSTIAAAFKSREDEPVTEAQMIATIRQEMQSALHDNLRQTLAEELQTISLPDLPQLQELQARASLNLASNEQSAIVEFWQKVESYLHDTRSKSFTPKRIDRKLQKLLHTAQTDLPNGETLPEFDRLALVKLLEQRQDLTDKRKDRILNQIEETWQQVLQDYADSSQATQSESNVMIDRVLNTLPEILQPLKTALPSGADLIPLVLSIALAKTSNSADLVNVRSLNGSTLNQTLDWLLSDSQLNLAGLHQSLLLPIERWRDRANQHVELIQQATQDRIEAFKQQAQQHVEDVRKAAAIAAWWLFATASTGAISAALAGALASGLNLTDVSL